MQQVLVAGYALMGDVEAERDDPGILDGTEEDALELMAAPQLAAVLVANPDKFEKQVTKLKELVEKDYIETHILDEEDENPELDLSWRSGVWDYPNIGRPNITFKLYDGDHLVGMLIIQSVTVE